MQENKTSRVFLIASVILGVLGMVVTFVLLQGASSTDNQPKIKMLVAARDLPANSALDPDRDLKEVDISTVTARAILTDKKLATYKGERLNRRVLAGQPVMVADFSAGMVDLKVAEPYRALSIAVRGANGLSGLLVPGDYVQVLVTKPTARVGPNAARPGESPTDTMVRWDTSAAVATPLRVLAVGQQLSRTRQMVATSEQFGAPATTEIQQTVTLEVTEDQAKAIMSQTGAGQFPATLILCPPKPSTERTTPAAPEAPAAPSPAAPATTAPQSK